MTSAALSSAPVPSQPPAAAGIAGSTRPAPSARGSRSTRTAPGLFTSVRVEILKMRRLRVLLVTALLVIASVALSSTNLFSQSTIKSFADPAAKPWAMLLLNTAFFNAMTGAVFAAVLASRQTDIEHSGAGWNLAATSGLTPGALCRVKLAALTLLIVPATIAQSAVLIVVARSMGLSLPLDAGPWVVYTLLLALVNTAMCAYHLWLAAVVENQLVVMSAGLLGGFIGVYMMLAPPALARLLPWGYYAAITPAKVSMVDGHGAYEYVQVPMGWVVGFLVLTAVIFTAATRRLDRIER